MTSQLSSDQIAQLTPLLGSLARLIGRGLEPGEAELATLVQAAGLTPEPALTQELQLWANLLRGLRGGSSEMARVTAAEALTLRGLPEAPVLLSVDTVSGSTSAARVTPAAPLAVPRLDISVASLDFGTLAAGQGGVREFEVQGGPGQVVVDSDQVRVTPSQFGAEPTCLRVEVRAGGGSLLWTPLRLVTAGETMEVPVLAQWESAAPVVSPAPPVAPPVAAPPVRPAAPVAERAATPAVPAATTPPRAALGDTWVRPTDGMVMVYVPGAEGFRMGSTDVEVQFAFDLAKKYNADAKREWFDDEKPAHTTALAGFWLDRTPVTNAQFVLFLDAKGNQEEGGVPWVDLDAARIESGSRQWRLQSGYADHPIVGVSWYGARAYAAWAGARLPTEAEWEYAARGPEGGVFPWGDQWDPSRCNSGEGGPKATTPAGRYPTGASWCGALDLAGNVWEWAADWYGPYPPGRQVNPTGPASGQHRVLRGGSWLPRSYDVRGANRYGVEPAGEYDCVGFRCGGSY